MKKQTKKHFALKIVVIKATSLHEAVEKYNDNPDKNTKIIKGFADSWEKGLKNLKKYTPEKIKKQIIK